MRGRTPISNGQWFARASSEIGILCRRICALILSQIKGWILMAETETYRITDQSGYLKVLVYERKYRGGVPESYEDRYEDVIRIESPIRSLQT